MLHCNCLPDSNELGVGLNERSSLLVPPQNAVPFSDEWLAAIEAAGEVIKHLLEMYLSLYCCRFCLILSVQYLI
ncbi:hypothetical protein MIMGU_mgv1a017462mg [Erythranthe guttata]|uniref:Uncharacterized protein n=1 Tax=Erythranthe guttata TaxID=4155 RepID=A0A022R871_ERYGU|nr:hypothetical protein MIMGU_mgv1a017462mg [Erythranthe guttata]